MRLLFVLFVCHLVYATEYFQKTPVKVRNNLLHWEKSEAYRDSHPMFIKEKIRDVSRYKNQEIVDCFPRDLYGDNTANSSYMVLLHAPNWNSSLKTPVLLIHGAADDSFRAWAHPLSATTPKSIPSSQQGFMQQLVKKGYPVFAINFSHNQGCNYLQAEQIHNAIQVIKQKTKHNKVNIIAHSKGNCAASIYMCGKQINTKYQNFLSNYKNDVETYTQLGAANKGIDLVFRYYTGNVTSIASNASSPVCFYQGLVYGLWQNLYEVDIYNANPGKSAGNYFPGQNQLLSDLVADGLDFSPFSYTPIDFNLTMKACYYGGTTAFVSSYGIQHAIKEGDYTIRRINDTGLAPDIRLINVYGTNPVMKEIDLGMIKIPIGVPDYPSDGLLYTHSASYVGGLIKRGARLIGQKGFDKNHLRIAYDQEVLNWVTSLWE